MLLTSTIARRLMACAILFTSPTLYAADARFSLPSGGALVLSMPAGWKQGLEQGRVPTLSLTPSSGPAFQVMVSPLVSPDGRVGSMSLEQLTKRVEGAATDAKAQAVEKSLPIVSIKQGQVEGAYFAATDRAPKPGEFKYMLQGALLVQGLPVTFTVLTNDNSKSAEGAALQMLRSARRE